jgi:hypothetical protein
MGSNRHDFVGSTMQMNRMEIMDQPNSKLAHLHVRLKVTVFGEYTFIVSVRTPRLPPCSSIIFHACTFGWYQYLRKKMPGTFKWKRFRSHVMTRYPGRDAIALAD